MPTLARVEWKHVLMDCSFVSWDACTSLGTLVQGEPRNEFASVDATLERLLGRPAVSVRQVLGDLIETHQQEQAG